MRLNRARCRSSFNWLLCNFIGIFLQKIQAAQKRACQSLFHAACLRIILFFLAIVPAAQETDQRLRIDTDISLPGTDVGPNRGEGFPPFRHQLSEAMRRYAQERRRHIHQHMVGIFPAAAVQPSSYPSAGPPFPMYRS